MSMSLTPRLVVRDADAAIAFYGRVFDAVLLERFKDEASNKVVHAAVSLGGENGPIVALTDADPGSRNEAPPDVGGSPVILHLEVDDADATGSRFVDAGGTVVFPIADQFYGRREGRLADPFGHLWIIGHETEALPPEEIQRRVGASGSSSTETGD